MNWDRVEGGWKQRRGKAVHHWGKLMNDELAAISGKHEELVGILQEKFGIAEEEAKRQISEFKRTIAQLKKANAKLLVPKKAPRNGRSHGKAVTVKGRQTSRK